MSFSSEVKKELCRTESFDREVLRAELYGMLLFGKTFRDNQIVFTTESSHAARRITMLLENLFMPIIEKQTALRPKSDEMKLYRISLIDSGKCRRVFESFGHSAGEVTLRVNRANVSSDEQSAAFVRGVFLSCGSASDPMKSYHAEFCVPTLMMVRETDTEVWGDFWVFWYEQSGDTLRIVSGGNHSGRMTIEEQDGKPVVTAFEQTVDGAGNDASARRIFGSYYDIYMNMHSNESVREAVRAEQLDEYVRNHR